MGTPDRILDAALSSFGTRGYEATSLDDLAAGLGVRKQTILYHFSSKPALLDAVIDRSGAELAAALEHSLARAGPGWERVEAIVRSVFRLAARRPELLGLVREVGRLGPPAATRLTDALDPLVTRATGVATEVDVLRALGVEPTARSLLQRRKQLLEFLRSALLVSPSGA